jgi:hypothetical protein
MKDRYSSSIRDEDEKEKDPSFGLRLAEEKALVGVEEVYQVPMKVRTAPRLGNQVGLTWQHAFQLK